jgi:hypothetical protein
MSSIETRVMRIDDEVYDLVIKRREEMWASGDRRATTTTALRALVMEALEEADADV